MQRRRLGRTGLEVSCLSVGTVELGQDYGIHVPGDFGRPQRSDAIALLQLAADSGVNLFDTAPTYGASEELLGEALSQHTECFFATKITVPTRDGSPLSGRPLECAVRESLVQSIRRLRRDVLDIVQIHNATNEIIERGEITGLLEDARTKGQVRFVGASVYGEDAALAAIRTDCLDVIQVAYNLLDQQMAKRVFAEARSLGVGVLARSPLLKGALTSKSQWLPAELQPLRQAVQRVRRKLDLSWDELPSAALRFCLSASHVSSVVFGPRTETELQAALAAVRLGPFEPAQLDVTTGLGLAGDAMLNPATWTVP